MNPLHTSEYVVSAWHKKVCLFAWRYEYHWCDGVTYKKPTKLPAPQYIELLMDWVESQINNEEVFPVKVGTFLRHTLCYNA